MKIYSYKDYILYSFITFRNKYLHLLRDNIIEKINLIILKNKIFYSSICF